MERVKTNKTAVSKMSVIELAETIVIMTDNKETVSIEGDAKPYVKELAKRQIGFAC